MNKKAVIFDCFGVLYTQSSLNFFERHKHLFKRGRDVLDALNLQIDLGKITRAEFFSGLEKELGMPADKIQTEIDQGLTEYDKELIEFIKNLKKSYKIGLLSNAGEEEISIIYRDKIDNLFDVKTISYEAGFVKPDPQIYSICLSRLGIDASDCVFIDDSKSCVLGAEAVGISSILFTNFEQLKKDLLTYNIS